MGPLPTLPGRRDSCGPMGGLCDGGGVGRREPVLPAVAELEGLMSDEKRKWGLALVNPERRKQIAARGMAALRRKQQQHQFTSATGQAARRKQVAGEEGNSDIQKQ